MALVATQGIWMPPPPAAFNGMVFNTSGLTIDATGEKIAFIGRVWNKDRSSKDITKVGFRFSGVTKAGGSGLTVSLQNVNTAAGPPFQPDETQDQTVAIANGDASFATNTWYLTGALSANRTVAFGELLAVVIEYDGGGRLGADSVVVSGLGGPNSTALNFSSGPALKTGGSWAVVSSYNTVLLEFSDGSFGTLEEGFPLSNVTTIAFNSGSAADEVALEFTVPFACKVDGAWMYLSVAASADFEIVLYDGTTALATCSFDVNTISGTAVGRWFYATFAEQTLAAGTTYRLALKPTTANNVTLYYYEVNAANHLQAHPGGTSWNYTTRVDAGSWAAATTTRRPFAGIRISALSDNASSGSGARIIGG